MIMNIVDRLQNKKRNTTDEEDDSLTEIQTLRAKVEVLEEYKNAVIDHFIVAFHGYDESKSVYDNLSLLIAYYQELALDPKVSKEASDLHVKVEVLEEALRGAEAIVKSAILLEDEVEPYIPESVYELNGCLGENAANISVRGRGVLNKITESLTTYDKQSEVKHDNI